MHASMGTRSQPAWRAAGVSLHTSGCAGNRCTDSVAAEPVDRRPPHLVVVCRGGPRTGHHDDTMHRAPESPASLVRPRRGLATLILLLLMASASLGGASHAAGAPSTWSWPVEAPPNVARGFDLAARYGAGHRGIDISAAPGDDVRSPAPGTVTFAGFVVDRPVLSIQHADGLLASYEPVVTQLSPGDVVSAGQRIGELSSAHRHTPEGAMHLGVRRDGAYLDPAPLFGLLRPPAAVLLPLYR